MRRGSSPCGIAASEKSEDSCGGERGSMRRCELLRDRTVRVAPLVFHWKRHRLWTLRRSWRKSARKTARARCTNPGDGPSFETLVADYQRSAQFLGKKLGTRENEIQALNRWIAHLGGVRVDWIKPDRMTDFRNRRKAQGVSARTINLDLVAFNNAMAYAVERGWLSALLHGSRNSKSAHRRNGRP